MLVTMSSSGRLASTSICKANAAWDRDQILTVESREQDATVKGLYLWQVKPTNDGTAHYVTVSYTLMWIWLLYSWKLLNRKKFTLLNPYHRHLLHDLTQFPNRIHLCNGTNTLLNGNKISFTPETFQLLFL